MSGATQQEADSPTVFYAQGGHVWAGFPKEHRSGGSMPTSFVRSEQEAFEASAPAFVDPMLILGLAAQMTPFRWNVGEGWQAVRKMRTGDMSFVGANTSVDYRVSASHEILVISFARDAVGTLLDDHRLGALPLFDALTSATLFRDETLRRTAMQMWVESARVGGTSDLLMDGLTQVLIARLLDKAGALRRSPAIIPLGQVELTRLDRVIDDRMAERITVEDLARTLDMPRWTFADAFKATTGDTPHSYVTAKRIERACNLLRLGDMPLAEIAYATGFASQSHMTDTFRKALGTTPGKWRREVR